MSESTSAVVLLNFGVYELDLRSGELRKAGTLLNLPPQPFRILVLLATHPGQLVTREEIQQQIWGGDTFVDFNQGLNFAINKIRTTLGDDAETPRYIETLPRRGYRFIAPVEQIEMHPGVIDGASSEGGSAPESGNPTRAQLEQIPTESRLQARSSLGKISLALMLVVSLLAASVWAWQKWRTQVSGLHSPHQITSLAVLPLENLSGDPSEEYFADGMTDELITDMASIASLRVISRTSTTHYKGTRKTISEIARELNVDAVVEGSVGLSGNKVRIRAQLIRAAPEEHVWAESYERDLPDVLALQRDVAVAIAHEIRVKVTPEDNARLAGARQIDPEAYQLYLRGRFSFESWTSDAVNLARENFHKAIAKDPNYALAYAELADTYVFGHVDLAPKVAIPLARAAALKALELDNTLGNAHASLAQVKFLGDWDWTGAEKEFRQAIDLDPGDPLAHHMYSHFLLAMGRNDESLRESELFLRLDPLSASANHHLAWHYLASGRYDLAIQQDQRALQMDSNYIEAIHGLGEAYRHNGMGRDAMARYEKEMTLSGVSASWIESLHRAYETGGWKDYWRKSLDRDLDRSNREHVDMYEIADEYALVGDKAQAFRFLEKAYADHEGYLSWIKTEHDFDVLHSDPRYAELLRRMGLP